MKGPAAFTEHGVESLDALVGAVRRTTDTGDIAQHVEATESATTSATRAPARRIGHVDVSLGPCHLAGDVLGRLGRALALDVGTPSAFGGERKRSRPMP
jgi:hypothetical protein